MNWQLILSCALIGLASILLLSQYVYALFFHKIGRDGSYTFAPFLLGLMIFVGVLLLPVELPFHRVLLAAVAMCFDITIPAFMYMLCTGKFKQA